LAASSFSAHKYIQRDQRRAEPRELTPQKQQEVRDRLKIGEPKDKLAREYGVDVDTIRQLVR
jgi:hypothetical protein